MQKKIGLVLLTWKRLFDLEKTLSDLVNQTYPNFKVYISHSNNENVREFEDIAKKFLDKLDLEIIIDSNDKYCFRRFDIARNNLDSHDIFFFLDDDVTIPYNYIENSIKQYKEKTYFSGHAYSFTSFPISYRNRKKYFFKTDVIGYCGAGMSMIDSSIFLYEDFFSNSLIKENYQLDDIWLSYFVNKIGWSLEFLDSGAKLGGEDGVAFYKTVLPQKHVFTQKLVSAGWNPPIDRCTA